MQYTLTILCNDGSYACRTSSDLDFLAQRKLELESDDELVAAIILPAGQVERLFRHANDHDRA